MLWLDVNETQRMNVGFFVLASQLRCTTQAVLMVSGCFNGLGMKLLQSR